MKKLLIFLCAVTFVFGMIGSASADPMTWLDIRDFNPDVYIGWFGSETYTHDISDGVDGYKGLSMGGDDSLTSYSLWVTMHDDGGRRDWWEIAYIDQPGIIGDGFYDFDYSSNTFGCSLAGLISLSTNGQIEVSIDSWFGDFYLDSSFLVAHGDNGGTVPVPEPATMFLMGIGLLAIGNLGIRVKKS